MKNLNLFLLGPFQAALAGEPLERFHTNKTRALLAYLAAENAQPQQRDFLAGLLWPGFSNDAALRNLRLALFHLRQVLDSPASRNGSGCILFLQRQTIQLNGLPTVWTDIQAFETLLDRSHHHNHSSLLTCRDCAGWLAEAAALYRGPFLENFSFKDSFEFEEWILLRRERLQQRALTALDQLASHFLWQAENATSVEERSAALDQAQLFAQRMIRLEPWRETAYQQLMKALAMTGQVQEAINQYQVCRQMLANEFGIEPGAATTQLYRQIREHVLDTRPQPAPARPAHNLPPQLTPLIGREAQLARIERLLFSYRWVTLAGEGGVGKTRLALASATQVLPRFPDGVWLVSLAETGGQDQNAADPAPIQALLLRNIAAVLGIDLEDHQPALPRVLAFLRDKKLLLILDSFEHLSLGADLIVDLLAQSPDLHILVTTRQVLYFQAGYIMRLDGLPVPETEDDPQGEHYPGVQLFAERVDRLSGSFQLDKRSLPLVIRICKFLDGIPLAIELAAPWATRISLETIAENISTDLDFLTTVMVGIPERHRSMRAVFESSWRLLNPREQRALAACATFSGKFSDAQLLAQAGVTPEEVASLVDKSMVLVTSPGCYQLHETLRQFVIEKTG